MEGKPASVVAAGRGVVDQADAVGCGVQAVGHAVAGRDDFDGHPGGAQGEHGIGEDPVTRADHHTTEPGCDVVHVHLGDQRMVDGVGAGRADPTHSGPGEGSHRSRPPVAADDGLVTRPEPGLSPVGTGGSVGDTGGLGRSSGQVVGVHEVQGPALVGAGSRDHCCCLLRLVRLSSSWRPGLAVGQDSGMPPTQMRRWLTGEARVRLAEP